METAITTPVKPLSHIDVMRVAQLTVPLIVAYLNKNYNQTQIAEATGKTRQAVNQFIQRHADRIAPLLDNDELLKLQVKSNAMTASQHLGNVLNSVDYQPTPKDLVVLNIVAGTQIQRFAELSGKVGNTVVQVQTVISPDILNKYK